MPIIEKLNDYIPSGNPIVLTVGNFDGMHRGHCAVLKHAQVLAGDEGKVVALTFRNHPSEVLKPQSPTPLLCSLPHKLHLLKQCEIHTILALPFTRYLAQQSAQSFIENTRQFIPFSHLVLGHDATLGRDRQGNAMLMKELGMEWGFKVHYLEAFRYEAKPISSTRIREALQQGDLILVEELLNRPYSIYGRFFKDKQKDTAVDFATLTIDVTGLCLPPAGIYAVEAIHNSKRFKGRAHIRMNSELSKKLTSSVEVHLFEFDCELLSTDLEVCFNELIPNAKNKMTL